MARHALRRRLVRWVVPVTVAVTAIMPAAAEASPAPEPTYCNVNIDTNTEKCFRTVSELRAYQAQSSAEIALTVWNWQNFNPGGGFRQYTGIRYCGDGTGVVASDRNLSDSYYSNVHTIMNDSIGSFRVEYPCGVAFWDYNNYRGARLPRDSDYFLGGQCGNLTNCTPEGNWNDRAGALLVYTGQLVAYGTFGDVKVISISER
jgi:hypothetical protein